MTTHWDRRVPGSDDAGSGLGAGARGPVFPGGPLAVGRTLGTVVVTLRGALDLAACAGLSGVLRDLIDGQGNLTVTVELGHVTRIDATGLDVLADAAARMAGRGGDLRLEGPGRAVFDSLVLAGLARLVTTPVPEGRRAAANHPGSRRASISSHPAGKGSLHHEGEAS